MNETITVIIIEEQEILRKGLYQTLNEVAEIKVVATATNWEEFLSLAKLGYKPNILFFNTNSIPPDLSVMKNLKLELPETKFIAITRPEYLVIQQLIDVGVISFLAPGFESQQLIRAIEISAKGEVFLHPHIAKEILERQKKILGRLGADSNDRHLLNKLTTREKEVLSFIAQGYNNIDIGQILFISPKTVRSHVKNIMDKLGFSDRIQAAFFAVRTGLVDLADSPYI